VTKATHEPAAPAAHDVVEIIDQTSSVRVSAVVESTQNGHYVLRFDHATSWPHEVAIRWHDGDTAWQALSRLDALDATSVNCQLPPAPEWQPAPPRSAPRIPVDKSPILIRILESSLLAKGHRVHAICLDISASGCRSTWPGPAPLAEDRVEITFEPAHGHSDDPQGWIPARIADVIPRPFGARHIDLRFELTDSTQAARIHAWHQTRLQEHHQRPAN
jgi:hypothetical protein